MYSLFTFELQDGLKFQISKRLKECVARHLSWDSELANVSGRRAELKSLLGISDDVLRGGDGLFSAF